MAEESFRFTPRLGAPRNSPGLFLSANRLPLITTKKNTSRMHEGARHRVSNNPSSKHAANREAAEK